MYIYNILVITCHIKNSGKEQNKKENKVSIFVTW